MYIEPEQIILIVEDETLVRMHGTDILASAGFSVLEAESGDQAIEILQTHRVHLLFSDIDLPGSMDGLELATFVRGCWPNVKLLLTSGHRTFDHANLPGGHFISKPWSENTLMGKVWFALRS